MDGKSSKGPDVSELALKSVPKTNKSVPRGLAYRELGFKQKQGRVSSEFQRAAEDRLVVKNHEELPCELPDASRSTFLMVFSPDGTKVASTHGNHNVYVTDLNTGKNVKTLSGHPRTPWCITFHPSSNQILASGCLGGQVRVWDLHGGSEVWTTESQTVIASLAFHPTDRILVIATYNEILFWDWSRPVPFTKCYTSNEREKVRYVAFDPLGHKLITGISNAPHNQTQWDRVAAPAYQGSTLASTSHSYNPRSPMFPPDRERRMAVCYRSLVEQYEQLVQRYYNLSRSRTPTMDRGTDPMDLSELSPARLQSGSSRTQPHAQHSTLPLEQRGSFARLRSQALPPSACPPERPCRFFVSQRSAFHPRIPRRDQHPHSDSQFTAGPSSAIHTSRSGYILHRRLRDAYQLQNFQDDNETSTLEPLLSQGLDNSSDVGVRYGIQLLSRHIDNMQRLCRARLEILQLQQIRRMWEDLQRQIRSLHVAVRDSTFALTGTHSVPGGRSRRRFRLCSNPCEDSGRRVSNIAQLRQNNQRSGGSEPGSTEQGPHIPSVSQMLKSAHISDTGPPSDSSQIPANTSDASATNKHSVSSEQGPSNQDCYRTGTLDSPHTQPEILTKKKLAVGKKNYAKKEEETSINNVAATSKTIVTTTVDIAEPVGTAANRFIYSDGEQSVSQSAKLFSFGGHEDSAEGPTQQDLPESRKGVRTSDLLCEGDNLNVKNIRNSPYGECSKTTSPHKKQRGDGVDSDGRSDPVDVSCNSQSDSCISVTGEGVCASSSSSNTPVVPPLNATIATTATTVTSSSSSSSSSSSTVDPSTVPSSSAVTSISSEALGHLPSNSWCRYGSANATINTDVSTDTTATSVATAASSQHQRLWRIGRRTYLRRPRLLTLGHRSRTISRQQSSNSASSQKNCLAVSFRSDPVDVSCNLQSDSCISVTGEGLCASSSSSNTPVVPPLNATIATTATTVTSSSSTVDPSTVPSSSAVTSRSSEALEHLPSNSWCRHGSANATINTDVSTDSTASPAATAAGSQHQRLWRIGRRVYLRRPRLLTLGHRSRTISRQQSSNSTSSRKNYLAGSFRRLESGRRPWFMQSGSSRSQHTRMSLRGINASARVGTLQPTLSNFAEESGSNGSGSSSGGRKQVNSDTVISSDTSLEVPLLDQNSSAGKAQQSADKRKLLTSTENDIQPGPSTQQEHVGFHASSPADKERDTPGTGIDTDMPTGTSRRASRNTGTGESDSPQQTQHEPTVYGSFRAVAARLQSLIRQRREQQESLRRESSSGRQSQQTDLWELRDRHLWFRGDTNSGSDSDSNPESDRHQVWEWPTAADRLIQVLGLMVESLTQFFEENGLSRSASHAVLDEQLYNLYILLQLALELTDLLLAQLVTTRRELEHQWMHRLHSPVALDATTPAGQHQLRRCRGTDRPQESHSLWQEYLGHERPYRRLLRYRHHPFIESDVMTELDGVSGTVRGVRSSPRRLNCYSRRESHTGIAATLRVCREMGSRPLMRGAIPRRANAASHLPPYTRSAGIQSSYTSRETGHHLLAYEEPPTTGLPEIRSPHVMATDDNVPIASMPLSGNQQNNEGYHQQQQQPQPQQDTFTVPLVQVNDVFIPDTSVLNQPQPRQRPQSPPPPHASHLRNPFIQQQQQSQHTQSPLRYLGDSWRYPVTPGDSSWRSGWRSRFLHPRYVGQNPFSEDQDEPLIGPALENINIIRDAPMSANHRIQVWDFTKFRTPDISNAEKNVVVAECKIQNDASVDVSTDGRLLVTLLPTGRLRSTDMLGIYSLEWESLGQCLYTTSFEQSAVSVSLSPAGHHLLVGFASRRVALLPTDRHTMAQIFRLEGGLAGRTIGARGRLCHIRDIEQDREQGYMSLNCIRWAPSPGQGLVYGTNTGKLKVLQ